MSVSCRNDTDKLIRSIKEGFSVALHTGDNRCYGYHLTLSRTTTADTFRGIECTSRSLTFSNVYVKITTD